MADENGRRIKGTEHTKALYGIGAALTLSHYAEGHGEALGFVAGVADIFNPLSLVNDATGMGDAVSDFGGAIVDVYYGVAEDPEEQP